MISPELTSRDYDTNREALIEAAKKAMPGKWTSFRDADFGSCLLELIAYDMSILSYVLDEQHLERYLSSLTSYESAILFAVQSGYRPRLAAPAALDAIAELTENPDPSRPVRIKSGTLVRTEAGQVWEVDGNYEIPPNRRFPTRTVVAWGQLEYLGEAVYLSIDPGSSQAYLSDFDGNRLPSDVNFLRRGVLAGQILTLTGMKSGSTIGAAPPISRREFAIVDVGSISGDLNDGSVLYLDRQWDGADKFIGTFVIESYSITLVQGQVKEEVIQGPTDNREGHTVVGNFTGVSSASLEPFIPSNASFTELRASAVTVNGQIWRETSSLALEGPQDSVYEASVDADQRLVIRFGDGINGRILPVGAEIALRYRTSSGTSGNIQQGGFAATLNAIQSNGRSATISLSNPYTKGSGGTDRETLDQLKAAIARFIRTNDRGVAPKDLSSLAINYRSAMYGSVGAVNVEHVKLAVINNLIKVEVWSETANGQLGRPSVGLLSDLRSYLTERAMVTDEIVTSAGRSTTVPISVRYRFDPTKISDQEAYEAVRSAINEAFREQQPGSGVKLGDLYEKVEEIDGIDYCDFHTPNVTLPPYSGVYINSLQRHSLTRPTLSGALPKPMQGTFGLPVSDPQFFQNLGPVSVFEIDRRSMTGTVERVDQGSGLITLRQDSPLSDTYSQWAYVINTDYFGVGWSEEHQLDLFIRAAYGNANSEETQRMVTKKLQDYFRWFVLPGDTIYRQQIEDLVASVPNVSFREVSFNLPTSDTQQVSSAPLEKIMLNRVTFL